MSPVPFTDLSLTNAVLACFGLAGTFVASLYLTDAGLPRDHPTTVKRRIAAVTTVTLLSPISLLLLLQRETPIPEDFLGTLGLKWTGLASAIGVPVALVMTLYLGPLVQEWMLPHEERLVYQMQQERRDILLRNYLVAPVAEEVVFRACMVPLLLPHLGPVWTVIVSPAFFGVAHLHHMFEHLRSGDLGLLQALASVLIQTCYTSVFGMFSAFLFLRTGHILSPILAHSMCNILGLPQIWLVHQNRHPLLVGVAYIIGLIGFLFLLFPLTDSKLFG